jgi:hypothetical protein
MESVKEELEKLKKDEKLIKDSLKLMESINKSFTNIIDNTNILADDIHLKNRLKFLNLDFDLVLSDIEFYTQLVNNPLSKDNINKLYTDLKNIDVIVENNTTKLKLKHYIHYYKGAYDIHEHITWDNKTREILDVSDKSANLKNKAVRNFMYYKGLDWEKFVKDGN